MRKALFIITSCILALVLLSFPVLATVTPSTPSIADGSTVINPEIGTFTIQMNATDGTMEINISLYLSTTLVTSSALTAQTNGSKSLTLPSLAGKTLYQIRVNSNDSTAGYSNTTYNFTTGIKQLTYDTDTFSTAEIAMLGIIVVILIIGFLWSTMKDIQSDKLSVNRLMTKLLATIIFVVVITIIAAII